MPVTARQKLNGWAGKRKACTFVSFTFLATELLRDLSRQHAFHDEATIGFALPVMTTEASRRAPKMADISITESGKRFHPKMYTMCGSSQFVRGCAVQMSRHRVSCIHRRAVVFGSVDIGQKVLNAMGADRAA
eukprot:TRINITY_DN41671_c0_g1_i1.p1 TRINITY_DN41671_c0_g1~~TRINITY_DN41671_c0_g1_i1.p1  ORF type:complete len:152 (-),score=9.87 TRINITY_DN41671_c0_g1_i1:43-441(-)